MLVYISGPFPHLVTDEALIAKNAVRPILSIFLLLLKEIIFQFCKLLLQLVLWRFADEKCLLVAPSKAQIIFFVLVLWHKQSDIVIIVDVY